MSKAQQKTFYPSACFMTELAKLKGVRSDWDVMKPEKIAKFFRFSFTVWQVGKETFKMETTITKPTQEELENAVLEFLS